MAGANGPVLTRAADILREPNLLARTSRILSGFGCEHYTLWINWSEPSFLARAIGPILGECLCSG